MDNNNTSIDKLNKRIEHYLEQEEYDRADDACLELCRAQGLTPADHMPEDFLSQLKRKEHETMHIKKTSKRISGVIAAAADDAGFDRIFKTNYTGDVFYYENEQLPDETDEKAGIGSTTDYSITGEISCGNGSFSIGQSRNYVNQSGEVSKAASMVITTTDETTNEREYLNASGISFQLSDDMESGNVRTTTMFTGEKYDTILQFTGMTEEEIHEVLDNIRP